MSETAFTLEYVSEAYYLNTPQGKAKGLEGLAWPIRPIDLRTGPILHSFATCDDSETSDESDPSLLLELAAETGDEGGFQEAIAQLSWDSVTATTIARYVRLAIKAGAHLTARGLARRGAQMFPNDTELRCMADVLAPPIAKQREAAKGRALEANRQWLFGHRALFQSKWVALKNGQVLASAESLVELRRLLGHTTRPSSDMLITRVD